MKNNFGKDFQQFALSVDIVDNTVLRYTRKLLASYLKDKLDIAFYELLIEHRVNQQKGLRTEWSSYDGEGESTTLYKQETIDGKKVLQGQTAHCFLKGIPMWVVSCKRDNPLTRSSYLDLWSNLKNIPEYWHYDKNPLMSKTSILLPLRNSRGKIDGVLNLESEKYLEISDFIKGELITICNSLTIIRELYHNNEFRNKHTEKALDRLRNIVELDNILTKPILFIASSDTADEELMGIVLDIARSYSEKVEVIYWKNISELGNINIHILKAIENASFGICYFSEAVSDPNAGENIYKDNPNVLFEAGMLHALTNDVLATPSAWIPIREEATAEKVPFDFASERILFVPRKNGELNTEKFTSELKKHIEVILSKK